MADMTIADTIPPQSLDAEKGVLGAILIHSSHLDRVADLVKRNDFYRDAHQRIFQHMLSMYERAVEIDFLTLKEELSNSGELDRVGGPAYIASLADGIPKSINAEHYARIVREKSTLRELIHAANRISSSAYEQNKPVDEVLDEAERLVLEVADKRIRSGFVSMEELVQQSFETIEKIQKHKGSLTGVASGYEGLDELTSGFQPSDLVIVAGRPSMGKTGLALNVAQHVAIKEGGTVGIFSLEMAKEQLVMRLLTSTARLDSHKFRTGHLKDEDYSQLAKALDTLASTKIFVDDSPSPSVLEMRAKARRLKAEHDLQLLVVDYIQLMQGHGRFDSRVYELASISRSLKMLAKELNVPIVVLSQLSRAPEARPDGRPQLADLRESGALEQDADVVLLIYREHVYKPTLDNEGIAQVIIAKQRNGPTGDVQLAFVKEYASFENLSRRSDKPQFS